MANEKIINIGAKSYVMDGAMPIKNNLNTVLWNTEYHLGTVTELLCTFPTPPADISATIVMTFSVGASNFSTTLVPPSGYNWSGLEDIVFNPGKIYELYFKAIRGLNLIHVVAKSYDLPLPEDYIRLSHIQSTGTEWIDSGYTPTTGNIDVRIQYMFLNTTGARTLFGYGNDSTLRYFCLFNHTDLYIGKTRVAQISGSANTLYELIAHATSSGSGSYTLNGTTTNFTITNPTTNFANGSFLIFNQGASTTRLEYAKLYAFQMWENGILVRDFIPCIRKSDGAVGLYDLCGSASPFDGTPFYGNSGTGAFYPGILIGYDSLIEKHTTNVGTYGTVSASQYKSGYAGNAYMAVDGTVTTVADVYYGSAYANGTYIQYVWNTAVKHIDYVLVAGFIDGAGTITTGALQYTTDGTTWTTAVTLNSNNFKNNYASGGATGVTNLYLLNLDNVKGIRIGSTASSNSRGMVIRELLCYGSVATYNKDFFYTDFSSLDDYQISGGEFLHSATDGLYIAENTTPGSALPYGDYGRICKISLPFVANEFEISFSTMITSTAVNRIGYILIAFNGKTMQQGLTFYDADGQAGVYDHSTVYRVNTTVLMSTGQVTTLTGVKVPEKCTYRNGILTLEYKGSVVSTTAQTLEPIREITIYFGSPYNTTYPLPELHLYDFMIRKLA